MAYDRAVLDIQVFQQMVEVIYQVLHGICPDFAHIGSMVTSDFVYYYSKAAFQE
jgi:hypothetical protein